jgi:hypothetical protein
VPSNDLQRVVACVTMLCGTTLFSYIIGAVSELAQNPTGGAVRRSGTMQVRCTTERFLFGSYLHNEQGGCSALPIRICIRV